MSRIWPVKGAAGPSSNVSATRLPSPGPRTSAGPRTCELGTEQAYTSRAARAPSKAEMTGQTTSPMSRAQCSTRPARLRSARRAVLHWAAYGLAAARGGDGSGGRADAEPPSHAGARASGAEALAGGHPGSGGGAGGGGRRAAPADLLLLPLHSTRHRPLRSLRGRSIADRLRRLRPDRDAAQEPPADGRVGGADPRQPVGGDAGGTDGARHLGVLADGGGADPGRGQEERLLARCSLLRW